MQLFKKILCPVDFSENSVRALQWTEYLATKFQSEVVVLHVMEPVAALGNPGFDYDHYRETVATSLRDFLVPLKVKNESLLSTGYPSEKILSLAKGLDVSLIVMATRGLKGATHKVLGSTTENVVRTSMVPVMTISPYCRFTERQESKRVLLPISSLLKPPRGFIRIRKAIRELGAFPAWIHIVSLNDSMFDSSFAANPFLVTTYETTERRQELARIGATIMATEKPMEAAIQFGNAAQEILKEVDTKRYDYILMGAKRKTFLSGFMESTVYSVISSSPIPVITVKTS